MDLSHGATELVFYTLCMLFKALITQEAETTD